MSSTGYGVACPHCGSRVTAVIDSRGSVNHVRRRRRCLAGHRFTTYEITEQARTLAEEQMRGYLDKADMGMRLANDLASLLELGNPPVPSEAA